MAFVGQEYCSDNFSAFTDDSPELWHNAFNELHKLQPFGTSKEHFTVRGHTEDYIFPGQICQKVRWFADIYDGNEHGVFVQFACDGSAKMAFRTWDGDVMSSWSEIGGTASNVIVDDSLFAVSPEMPGYIHGAFDLFVKGDNTAHVTDVAYSEDTPDSVRWDSRRGLLIYTGVTPEVSTIPSIDIGLGVILYSDHELLSGYGFTLPLKNYTHSTVDTWTFSDSEHGTAKVRKIVGTTVLTVEFELNGGKFLEKFAGSEVFATRITMVSVSGNISEHYAPFMQSAFA